MHVYDNLLYLLLFHIYYNFHKHNHQSIMENNNNLHNVFLKLKSYYFFLQNYPGNSQYLLLMKKLRNH